MGNAKSPGVFPTPIEEKIVESCDLEIAIPEIRILIELISINRINHKKKKQKSWKRETREELDTSNGPSVGTAASAAEEEVEAAAVHCSGVVGPASPTMTDRRSHYQTLSPLLKCNIIKFIY